MSAYWDTSAIINAVVSPKVSARLNTGEHYTRLHSFSEFFAIMTTRGIQAKDQDGNLNRVVLSQKSAATWLRKFSGRVKLVELNLEETLAAFDEAAAKSVQGGKVYDYGHALAAEKAGSAHLLTRNTKHFGGLTQSAKVEWP